MNKEEFIAVRFEAAMKIQPCYQVQIIDSIQGDKEMAKPIEPLKNSWLKRITDYYKDKILAEKCGLKVKDVCVHELKPIIYPRPDILEMLQCMKCGELYK